jgi:hypothetical protein
MNVIHVPTKRLVSHGLSGTRRGVYGLHWQHGLYGLVFAQCHLSKEEKEEVVVAVATAKNADALVDQGPNVYY